MKNFQEMPYGEELLREMYNTPRSEFSTQQIVELLREKLSCPEISELHVAKLYQSIGLSLRNRLRMAPKPEKLKKVNPMEVLLKGLKTPENGSIEKCVVHQDKDGGVDDLSDYDEGPEYCEEFPDDGLKESTTNLTGHNPVNGEEVKLFIGS